MPPAGPRRRRGAPREKHSTGRSDRGDSCIPEGRAGLPPCDRHERPNGVMSGRNLTCRVAPAKLEGKHQTSHVSLCAGEARGTAPDFSLSASRGTLEGAASDLSRVGVAQRSSKASPCRHAHLSERDDVRRRIVQARRGPRRPPRDGERDAAQRDRTVTRTKPEMCRSATGRSVTAPWVAPAKRCRTGPRSGDEEPSREPRRDRCRDGDQPQHADRLATLFCAHHMRAMRTRCSR